MSRWLLSAEADKIQDLVFRSTRLRGVVGGSQLLTRFCGEGTRELLSRQRKKPREAVEDDILVADGGSFSILFDEREEAARFGRSLAELYHLATGGTLSVAEPQEWTHPPEGFETVNRAARDMLALAKQQRRRLVAPAHLPHAAFCASCGVSMARWHHKLPHQPKANYLCASCLAKEHERRKEGTAFLATFKEAVLGGRDREIQWAREADDLAGWDSRNYVAYLVADGNAMGQVFDKCQEPETLHDLSEALTKILRESLAAPAQVLMNRARGDAHDFVPALPLILGGDDVFLLLPAPYALDFAQRFCLEYEKRMHDFLTDQELGGRPTMSAAVVVCKSTYPHALAHKRGEELLHEAKRLAKSAAREGVTRSVVHFDLILGSRIASSDEETSAGYRGTLRPYWVLPENEAERAAAEKAILSKGLGLPLDRLIEQRRALCVVPARRMAQLRAFYAPGRLPGRSVESLGRWNAGLDQLLARIGREDPDDRTGTGLAARVRTALGDLGGDSGGYWYHLTRPDPRSETTGQIGHGLPDLITMWDYCFDLDLDRDEYEPREGGR